MLIIGNQTPLGDTCVYNELKEKFVCLLVFFFKKAQWVTVPGTLSDNQDSKTGIHMTEGENGFLKLVLCPSPHAAAHTPTHVCAHTLK